VFHHSGLEMKEFSHIVHCVGGVLSWPSGNFCL